MILDRRSLIVACMLALWSGQFSGAETAPPSYQLLVLDGHELKWGQPVLGTGAVVTYSLVPTEVHFARARNCAGIAPIEPLLSANRIDAAVFWAELRQAFGAWQSVVGIDFLPGDPATADILIGVETEPKGKAYTNVTFDERTTEPGARSISRALICLNPAERWKIGFDGNLNVYDLRYTLMHEIGHAIGLDHPEKREALMYVDYEEKFRAPQSGDIHGAATLYGPASPGSAVASMPKRAFTPDAWKEWVELGFHLNGGSAAQDQLRR